MPIKLWAKIELKLTKRYPSHFHNLRPIAINVNSSCTYLGTLGSVATIPFVVAPPKEVN